VGTFSRAPKFINIIDDSIKQLRSNRSIASSSSHVQGGHVNKFSSVIFVLFFISMIVAGCGTEPVQQKPIGDEPTEYQSQAGLEALTKQAAAGKASAKPDTDNPTFFAARDAGAKARAVQALDTVIRPILKQIFGDAKIVSESKSPETQKDGEVIENSFTYIVRKKFVSDDGKRLHASMHAAHFGPSPRLGRKPTIARSRAMMSLFYTHASRPYSLVIKLDSKKQEILVLSYKLGSKYDRLM